ncbi:DNA-binding response regulator [Niabella ginsenosidivorans]|uniref:DNA-binding response regulator n=1 Tax=Niabella ginsenosidivorans TaxID=1176587 RepID=A0A1A9I404_9BACT|nr:response regulator transcription factor [Niabella ginsenosidivorans]ANH82045.1 DNA-binding response regulator [Niabella ginsenosidivorans]
MLHNKISVAIVDDHPVVVEGLKTLLKNDEGIGGIISCVRGKEIIECLQEQPVDLVLLDIILPDANGIELCKEIKKIAPETIILGLSNQAERSIILQMMQNGASGYLLKNASAAELLRCIAEVQEGKTAFSDEVKEIMARPSHHDLEAAIPSLTKREKQILKMIANGDTSQQIAATLFLSTLTVETHRRNLLHKLKAKNVAGLIKRATEYRLL